ncbi:MAG: amino acid adenylation domain-containing protein [Vicinamibacterales bacterium]
MTGVAGPPGAVHVFPASLAQQRLWFLSESDPTGVAYTIAKATLIRGALDEAAFAQALETVIARHEALRTHFDHVDGRLVQVVAERLSSPLEIEDVAGTDDHALTDRARELVRAEAQAPFDLRRGPLVRARLYRLGGPRYLFCLSLHHAIADGWSLGLLQNEITRAYAAHARGEQPALGDPPLQYADYAVWEAEQDTAQSPSQSLAYWREVLADLPPGPAWPADYVPASAPTWRGQRIRVPLAVGTGAAVHRLARACRTTPAAVLVSAFAAFLARWTGDRDLAIGMPVAGRDRVELEPVVGCFVNTIVARLRVEPALPFSGLLEHGRQVMLDALRHRDARVEAITDAVRASGGARTAPLFRALFTLHAVPDDTVSTRDGLEYVPLPAPTGTAKTDVSLTAVLEREDLTANIVFSDDLFASTTMGWAARAFGTLLASALAEPDLPVSALACDPDGQRAVLRGPSTACPRDASIHELFTRAARRHGPATAIDTGHERVSYAALQRWSSRITGALQEQGVQPGDRVGVLATRDAPMVAALLGVLEAGAVYVPLDPQDPPAHRAATLADADVTVVLAPVASGVEWPPDVRRVDPQALHDDSHPIAPAVATASDTAACLLYTSGSTGAPKGVLVPHRGVVRLVVGTDYLRVGPGDRVAQAANPTFDAATLEIWGALLNGATLVPLPAEVVVAPAALAREIRRRQLDVLFVTTAVFNQVARSRPSAFAPLRALFFGGEAASPTAVAAVLGASPPERLVHAYGPTECTTFATVHHVRTVAADAATVPIGRPIAWTIAAVMDEAGRPVARGLTGELWLAGDGLALGYHKRPDETDARFVDRDGTRWYRTGDVCRLGAEGALVFVGRLDRQLKIRGHRIEPAAIEGVLGAHPAVTAAVVGIIGDGDERRLVAAVTLTAPGATDADALRGYLAARLPRHAVPSVACVDALPLTPQGKVDHRALAAAITAQPARAVVPPRDPLEAELAALWESLLDVRPVGVTDDFFALGGHSLLAAEMMLRVETLFGERVPLRVLLEHPTIEGLAGALWRARHRSPGPLTALRTAGARPPLFFLHGDLNGAGLYCARLARELPESQPVYTIAPLGIEGDGPPPSIETMATAYTALIRERCPEGPIAIGGYCHGALVAFEVARHLRRERDVVRVLMVHPPAVEPRLAPVDAAIRALCRLTGRDEAARVDLTLRIGDAARVLAQSTARGVARFAVDKARRFTRGRTEADGVAALERGVRHDPQVWARYVRAIGAYVPRRLRLPVSLLVSDEASATASQGWLRAAPGARLVPIPGDHRGCVTTHLESLAQAMEAELSRPPAPAGRARRAALMTLFSKAG